MAEVAALGVSLARWLGAGALDGTLLAAAAWLACVTLLRRSSGRVLALLWLGVLVDFTLLRPVQMRPVQMFALPQLAVLDPAALAAIAPAPPSLGYAVLVFVYGAVVSLLIARLVIRQRRLRRRIRSFSPAEPVVLSSVRAAARRLSLARLPEVRITDAPISPFTLGPLEPTLVLPRWLCLPGARLDAVLLHELAHLARRDHLLIWLERGVASLFFFWPPVHWVCLQLDEARELACDERAIRCGAFPAVEYGQHLVAVVALARERLAVGGALRIARSAWRLERRIDRLLQGAWAERRSWLEGAALSVLAVCALLGVRPAPALRLAAPSAAAELPASSGLPGEPLMSIDESQLPRCVLQGCGTQCVP